MLSLSFPLPPLTPAFFLDSLGYQVDYYQGEGQHSQQHTNQHERDAEEDESCDNECLEGTGMGLEGSALFGPCFGLVSLSFEVEIGRQAHQKDYIDQREKEDYEDPKQVGLHFETTSGGCGRVVELKTRTAEWIKLGEMFGFIRLLAHPAEFMLAGNTSHVIAARLFVYVYLTAGALDDFILIHVDLESGRLGLFARLVWMYHPHTVVAYHDLTDLAGTIRLLSCLFDSFISEDPPTLFIWTQLTVESKSHH